MHAFGAGQIVIPLAVLLVENDEDREFLTEIYLQYYGLLYKTASEFFSGNGEETVEAVSDAVERMCKYFQNIKAVPCEKRAAYLIKIVRSVCNTRLGEIQKEAMRRDIYTTTEDLENIEDVRNGQDMIFSYLYAKDILDSFDELNDTDRRLIRMRHIDGMSYKEIAALLSVSEGAVRTAVSRAKSRLEKIAKKRGYILHA